MIGGELLLILALARQPKEEQIIPLVFRGQVVLITESAAQREYDLLFTRAELSDVDQARLSALAVALGSIPNRCTISQARALLCVRTYR
jgi:hypothetical protein